MMPVTDIVVLLGAILYGIAEHFSARVHFAVAGGRDGLFFLFSFRRGEFRAPERGSLLAAAPKVTKNAA